MADFILSIIIPVYNVEKYISKTLDSIFSQYYTDDKIEVIIINDGTPDNSMEIVKKYICPNTNLIIINQKNQGLSVARNTGLKYAKGKYVWFVDSDDWIEKGCLVNIINNLNFRNVDVFIYKIREYDENGHVLLERKFVNNDSEHHCTGADVVMYLPHHQTKYTPMQMYIIKRAFLIDNNLWFVPNIYHEDIDFAPRMLVKTDDVVYVPQVSYCYLRRSSGSITSNEKILKKRVLSLLTIFDSHRQMLISEVRSDRRRALYYDLYRIAQYIWRLLPEPYYSNWYQELNLKGYLSSFRILVLKNILCDRPLWHFPGRVIFFLSPKLLKKLKKSF